MDKSKNKKGADLQKSDKQVSNDPETACAHKDAHAPHAPAFAEFDADNEITILNPEVTPIPGSPRVNLRMSQAPFHLSTHSMKTLLKILNHLALLLLIFLGQSQGRLQVRQSYRQLRKPYKIFLVQKRALEVPVENKEIFCLRKRLQSKKTN